ncbi:MAG TPA: nitroreductase/quinone reductase family protein [Solirubrobacteraceae bacterium]|nr:nitroreductase/quinone reductase family protein [Solirubrobacteraceae bacterium]
MATDRKRRLVTALQVRVFNPPVRWLAQRGLAPKVALLETTGRRSGRPRTTPVTNGLRRGSNVFWLVAEHGRKAAYVRNIEADPRVRVRVGRRWRSGIAHVLPDDDPVARQRTLPRLHSATVRAMGSELVTVRIDLDPL